MLKPTTVFILTLSLVASLGCSQEAQKEVAMRKDCLARIGVVYPEFVAAKGKAPSGIEELATFVIESSKLGDEVAEQTAKRLREGDIIVYWGSVLNEDKEENEKYVLAIESQVVNRGGYIVTGGGTVVLVSPKSFKEYKEYPAQQP